MLGSIRSVLPADVRERAYVIAGAIVAFLVSWGKLDASEGQQWGALVVATITLLFAILYSTATVRTAFYTLMMAVQGVAGLYGILNDQQWGAIVALTATVLGVGTAAAKTRTPE